MIKTNKDRVVMQSIQGKVSHPISSFPYRISHDGEPMVLPATGGITYNVMIGDSVFGWAGDHIEPGVSLKNPTASENNAFMLLSCIGNKAYVVTGDAKGAQGYVTGTHGGIEHVLAYFDRETLEKMNLEDKVLIKAWGQGLSILDHPEIKVMNIDPDLLDKLDIQELPDGSIEVPVVAEVPAYLMGSGIGSATAASGDYDIMTADMNTIKQFGLDTLRFGDIVLLKDCDNTYGRGYLKGAVSVGVVVHSDCIKMGHGPGITTIMTCKMSKIKPRLDKKANIGYYLGILSE